MARAGHPSSAECPIATKVWLQGRWWADAGPKNLKLKAQWLSPVAAPCQTRGGLLISGANVALQGRGVEGVFEKAA